MSELLAEYCGEDHNEYKGKPGTFGRDHGLQDLQLTPTEDCFPILLPLQSINFTFLLPQY